VIVMVEDTRPEAPQYVAARLQRALAEDPRTAAQGVRVTVRGGDVYLRGDVACEERREELVEVAREIVPDGSVHNETRVVSGTEPADEEELR
jgi:osmotically-inducible protein OsmY